LRFASAINGKLAKWHPAALTPVKQDAAFRLLHCAIMRETAPG
jgi:hypothetical protein